MLCCVRAEARKETRDGRRKLCCCLLGDSVKSSTRDNTARHVCCFAWTRTKYCALRLCPWCLCECRQQEQVRWTRPHKQSSTHFHPNSRHFTYRRVGCATANVPTRSLPLLHHQPPCLAMEQALALALGAFGGIVFTLTDSPVPHPHKYRYTDTRAPCSSSRRYV